MSAPEIPNAGGPPPDRFENVVISTGDTLYVGPEILELMKTGFCIEKVFVENHSRGDCGIYGETLEEIAAHVARIDNTEVNPPIISAYPVPEHNIIVIFLSDRQNSITHIFGMKMDRCSNRAAEVS